jgi:integrase
MKEGLKIPKSHVTKGLYIYCNKCKKIITDKYGQSNSQIKCKHYEDQVFKSVIYPPGAKTAKTKVLATNDVNEARKLHIEFEERIKLGKVLIPEKYVSNKPEKPQSIKGSIGLYFAYQIDISQNGVKSEHQKQVERYILEFARFLKKEGLNLDSTGINDIEPKYIKLFRNHLEEKYSSTTFNRYLTLLKSFFNHLIHIEGYVIRNPFLSEKHKPQCQIPKSFPIRELEPFLLSIIPEKGIEEISNRTKKQRYTHYLKHFIKLGAFTGLRRDGLLKMKFSDITSDHAGRPVYIKTEDYKFNKRYNLKFENEKKYIILPIPLELENLLYELGFKENVNSDKLIIGEIPNESEYVIKEKVSKGFSHFWGLYSQEEGISFKSLRKSYITEINLKYGSIGKSVTHGATGDVVNKHYFDAMRIADDLRGKNLYSS